MSAIYIFVDAFSCLGGLSVPVQWEHAPADRHQTQHEMSMVFSQLWQNLQPS